MQPRKPSPTGILLRAIQTEAEKRIKKREDIFEVTIKLEVDWEFVERIAERTDLRYSIVILRAIKRYDLPHLLLIAGTKETLMHEWNRKKERYHAKGYNIYKVTSNSL